MPARALLLLLLCIYSLSGNAQVIHGEVLDMEDKQAVEGVAVVNIHSSFSVSTDNNGTFVIAAVSDELLEFQKAGYRTVRVRIPKGFVPSYFRIIMTRGFTSVQDIAQGNRYDSRGDSMRMRELYKHELDFPRMSTFDMIAHPFSALSGKNREIWAFQDNFYATEREKYVDKTFNAALITKFTGLQGDSLRTYMIRYRPTYEQLRGMSDYSFFNYIRMSVKSFRTRQTPRGAQ